LHCSDEASQFKEHYCRDGVLNCEHYWVVRDRVKKKAERWGRPARKWIGEVERFVRVECHTRIDCTFPSSWPVIQLSNAKPRAAGIVFGGSS